MKSEPFDVPIPIHVEAASGTHSFGAETIRDAVRAKGINSDGARLDVVVEHAFDDPAAFDATVVLVNTTPDKQRGIDANLYEVRLTLDVGELKPMLLDALPDSFRYDRRITAFGIYGGVAYDGRVLSTTDAVVADRRRPEYWDAEIGSPPDLTFEVLATDPLPHLRKLVAHHRRWGELHWSDDRLRQRAKADRWPQEVLDAARAEAERFWIESAHLEAGLESLEDDGVLRAFKLMNRAFSHSSRGRYDGWRAFQLGFLLIALPSLCDRAGR